MSRITTLCACLLLAVTIVPARADQPPLGPLNFGARLGTLQVSFSELDWNHKTGDFIIPGAIAGKSPTSDFRADRANGNDKTGFINLIGHVVVHVKSAGRTRQPVAVTSDQLRYDYRAGIYTASGNVRLNQGIETLTAPLVRVDDANHVADLSGGVHYQATDGRLLDTDALTYHTDSGDFIVPGHVSGSSPAQGSFSADSASGNSSRNDVTLVGDVMVHKLGGFRKLANSSEPVTLQCDTMKATGETKIYVASGHVRVTQGDRVMTAPLMQLNDNTHVLTMTGGVKANQPPSSSFEAPEVIYNTDTEDFRALGGVHATVPVKEFQRRTPTPKPTKKPPSAT